jgi:hypothetical protein
MIVARFPAPRGSYHVRRRPQQFRHVPTSTLHTGEKASVKQALISKGKRVPPAAIGALVGGFGVATMG